MIKITGLDEFTRKLKNLERQVQSLDGIHNIPVTELFPPEFMRRHTDFDTFGEMVDASGFKIESQEDFRNIPDQEWDDFVAERTRFLNWKDMMGAAGKAWASKKLRL